jgi:hypothetical protein
MSQEKQRPKGSQTGIIERLIDAGAEDRARDERQTQSAITALQDTNRMLTRVVIALVVVLGILVSGVVGVGVTGKVPGYGEITVTQPGKEAPAP